MSGTGPADAASPGHAASATGESGGGVAALHESPVPPAHTGTAASNKRWKVSVAMILLLEL